MPKSKKCIHSATEKHLGNLSLLFCLASDHNDHNGVPPIGAFVCPDPYTLEDRNQKTELVAKTTTGFVKYYEFISLCALTLYIQSTDTRNKTNLIDLEVINAKHQNLPGIWCIPGQFPRSRHVGCVPRRQTGKST